MELSNILAPGSVRALGHLTSKKRILQELADTAAARFGLPASAVFDALQDRETLGPTGVGQGVALPHARVEGLEQVHGVFVRLEKPVDFDSVDRKPVDLVFGLFAPIDSGVDHLKALAMVSRTLRDRGTCVKLRSTDDPAALYAILTEGRTSRAA
ncbi:MAG: PTS lactose transporter subunit IIC [Alphaproteobacteria bacterium HGW-Alphaproteobacteria-2]|nr:MAG: PTS lactose transporter subunit IIC [Alphaproteobacteria bacterium HGW-Alphaproteobacteria-2]